MKPPAARDAIRLLHTMTRVLCAVGVLALAFTTVNVTRFATSRDVPLGIAILLDPMLGTALAGVLYADARLAAWGIRPPTWSTTLRWSAGSVAALMNTWESLWPDGQIGWPRKADPAAVLLHITPALLLILLTETIAAYRRTITDLLDRIGTTDPAEAPPPRETPHRPTDADGPEPLGTDHHAAPRDGYDIPESPHPAPTAQPGRDNPTDANLWPLAVTLDDTVRAATGRPVSVWRLRTELRIGPERARQIRTRLLTRRPHVGSGTLVTSNNRSNRPDRPDR
ncbi:extensin [Streptomyces sp. BH055]|uniref:extensin n=1 Tax=Streptomyces sp. BH055 TaxID=3401173 RepID=UPI003BB711D7